MDDGKIQPAIDCQKLERSFAHNYFCRFHMSVILAAVISSGVLASKGLMEMGVSLGYRYPIAVAISYLVFLLLIRVWIWYVMVRSAPRFRGSGLGSFNFGSGGGGSSFDIGSISGRTGTGFSGFRGGSSGGGGASSDWEAGEAMAVAQPSSGGSSSLLSGFDLGDAGDNGGWLVVVLLIALVACILGGGVYLVVVAPHILPEAAAQVILAGGLKRVSKEQHHNWMSGVIWSTWIPFVVVLLMASVLGWEVHRHCPPAIRLLDLLNCPAR